MNVSSYMKVVGLFLFLLYMTKPLASQSSMVYLLPGHGADERIFSKLDLGNYPTKVLSYPIPHKGEAFSSYVQRIATQIDTAQSFSLVGMSFGGMVAVELSKHIPADQVILVSSAKCADELPPLYKSFRNFPIHKVLSGQIFKWWGLRLQPMMEPIPKDDQAFFQRMLKAKHPKYLKRTIAYIISWQESDCAKEFIHIHGSQDKTLPYKFVRPTITVEDAGHMMVYTHAEEVSHRILQYLP